MRFSLKNLSLGVVVASFAAAGLASAQTLVGVNSQLTQSISTQSAKKGDAVTAKLKSTITADGVKLPKGTQITGAIAAVQPSQNRGPATLSIVFTKAQLRSGKTLPIKATVIAAYSATQGDNASGRYMPAPPATVANDASVQQPGAIGKVSLDSSAKNSNSALFARKDGNFTLDRGTYLQLGIAPENAGSSQAAE